MTTRNLRLIPEEETKAQPLFHNEETYQDFRASLEQEVKDELDQQREARRQSEEQAKRYLISR